jgi:6-phosphogluconolactonase/glucosamine-6-phosphate isomerase/deaminase
MGLTIKITTNPGDAANFITSSILSRLKLGKHVLFFVTGGSSIAVGVKVAELLRRAWYQNLTVMLTDERYGPLEHPDSNWHQLMEKGFSLPQAKLIPILTGLAHRSTAEGDNRATTTKKFKAILNQEFMGAKENKYKIGLFGVGVDGHTAGILPESPAVHSKDLAFSYNTPTFSRITITPKAIAKLDEAVIWAQGEDKWPVVKDLLEKDISVAKQPAQILKKVPLLTIFTDYK